MIRVRQEWWVVLAVVALCLFALAYAIVVRNVDADLGVPTTLPPTTVHGG